MKTGDCITETNCLSKDDIRTYYLKIWISKQSKQDMLVKMSMKSAVNWFIGCSTNEISNLLSAFQAVMEDFYENMRIQLRKCIA